jgi:hypothetical protein
MSNTTTRRATSDRAEDTGKTADDQPVKPSDGKPVDGRRERERERRELETRLAELQKADLADGGPAVPPTHVLTLTNGETHEISGVLPTHHYDNDGRLRRVLYVDEIDQDDDRTA